MSAFSGNIHNYGQHKYGEVKDGEKREGKSKTIKDSLLTSDLYESHLDGRTGLGVVPIKDTNKCSFAVIDVDVYDRDLSSYLTAIDNGGFPIVPFKSKSGGLHLYVFFKPEVAAATAIDLMRQLAGLLTIDFLVKQSLNKIVEVFPKQTKLTADAVGNWINLPYYDATNTKQCAILGGKLLRLDDALQLIKKRTVTLQALKAFIADVPIANGPPCLQSIKLLDPLDAKSGGRNVYLFTMGVYSKKVDPEFFEQRLFEVNNQMSDPVTDDELEKTVLVSLRRKDYTYKCNEHPCSTFCNKSLCQQREFGIGKDGGYFSELEYGKMYQIKTMQPYYEWEVKRLGEENFATLRFRSESEIIQQDIFMQLCFRELSVLPNRLKPAEWAKIINQALADIHEVNVSSEDDTSPGAMMKSLFFEFLLDRAFATTRDQMLAGRVFFDKGLKLYLFRAKDLLDFLFTNKNFRYYSPADIHGFLKDIGAKSLRLRTETKQMVRVYSIAKDRTLEAPTNEKSFRANFEAGSATDI